MKIDIRQFTGMRPAINPRLLNDGEAQYVCNADMEDGSIIPLFYSDYVATLSYVVRTIYFHKLSFLGGTYADTFRYFKKRYSVTSSPLNADGNGRIYLSDDEDGGLYFATKDYDGDEANLIPLGVPAPTNAPTLSSVTKRGGAVDFKHDGAYFYFTGTGDGNAPFLYAGEKISFAGGSLPTGITAGTEYAVLSSTNTGTQVQYTLYSPTASTKDPIAFTTDGTGTGTASDDGTTQDRAYLYTMVNIYGEESAPSYPLNVTCDASSKVSLSGLSTPTTALTYAAFQYKRIYRSATGDDGTTVYRYVGETASSNTSFVDDKLDEELSENLPSLDWEMPNADWKHLHSMSNGVFVAHDEGNVYFSDAYHPYAWKESDSYSIRGKIINIGVTQNTVFVLTDARTYSITFSTDDDGNAYSTITTFDGLTPCLSELGVTESPYGILYPSTDGLYLAQPGSSSARNVTEQIISEREWREYATEKFNAVFYDSAYYAYYEKSDGENGGMFIDFGSSGQAKMRYVDTKFSAVYVLPNTNKIYYSIPCDDVSLVYAYNENKDSASNFTWHSKVFKTGKPTNFTCAVLEAYDQGTDVVEETECLGGFLGYDICGAELFAGQYEADYVNPNVGTTSLTVIADGTQRFNGRVPRNKAFRLPAGYKATEWEFVISSPYAVTRLAVAENMDDLKY